MKKRIFINIGKSLAFIGVFVCILTALSFLFVPKDNTRGAGLDDQSANAILNEKENTIDTLFLGDSESYTSFIPMKIWKEYGITSYVCGTPSQKLYYTDFFLQKAFQNQKPKLVFLETNALFRRVYFEDEFNNKLSEFFPILKYHDRWKTLQKNDWSLKKKYTYTEDAKGYIHNTTKNPASTAGYMTPTDQMEVMTDKNMAYLKKIISFCKKNNTKLILVSTPSTKNWNYKKHNTIEKIAKEYDIGYLDLNTLRKEIPIDWNNDTRDKGDHLNYYGAVKVTKYIGKYINDLKLFSDKRNDPEYRSWNDSLKKFTKKVKQPLN